MNIVEVRVTTYRRPSMLRRALGSVLAQTHTNWGTVVLDDSPDREGELCVREFADSRIHYRPNAVNLGDRANIDLAFRREAFLSGSTHACVLEDDNYLEPDFLADNLRLMQQHDVRLILRNQWIFWDDGHGVRRTQETCRSGFFDDGLLQPRDLLPHLPYHTGVSNGGLMWRLDCATNLATGPGLENPSTEMLRTFQVREPLWYADKPLAWFRAEEKGWRRGRLRNLRSLRAAQSIASEAVKRGPPDFWERAGRLADRHTAKHQAQLDQFALMALHWRHEFRTLSYNQAMVKMAKHAALRCSMRDPLGAYWRAFRP